MDHTIITTPNQPFDNSDDPISMRSSEFHGLSEEIFNILTICKNQAPILFLKFLVMVGNILGRKPQVVTKLATKYLNLFILSIGSYNSQRERKSIDFLKRLFTDLDQIWLDERIVQGLARNEGLYTLVDDNLIRKIDKRIVIQESNLDRLILHMKPRDNRLASCLREAWHGRSFKIHRKKNLCKVDEAHISIIAHMTEEGLELALTEIDFFHKIADFFLIHSVDESDIRLGDEIEESKLIPIRKRLKDSIAFSLSLLSPLEFDSKAYSYWEKLRVKLYKNLPDILKSSQCPLETHIKKLAAIFSILDCSPKIKTEHLNAAAAVWKYCENNFRRLFDGRTIDPTANKILSALEKRSEGMCRTEISQLFGYNRSKLKIENALQEITSKNLAKSMKIHIAKTGCPKEIWKIRPDKKDIN